MIVSYMVITHNHIPFPGVMTMLPDWSLLDILGACACFLNLSVYEGLV